MEDQNTEAKQMVSEVMEKLNESGMRVDGVVHKSYQIDDSEIERHKKRLDDLASLALAYAELDKIKQKIIDEEEKVVMEKYHMDGHELLNYIVTLDRVNVLYKKND